MSRVHCPTEAVIVRLGGFRLLDAQGSASFLAWCWKLARPHPPEHSHHSLKTLANIKVLPEIECQDNFSTSSNMQPQIAMPGALRLGMPQRFEPTLTDLAFSQALPGLYDLFSARSGAKKLSQLACDHCWSRKKSRWDPIGRIRRRSGCQTWCSQSWKVASGKDVLAKQDAVTDAQVFNRTASLKIYSGTLVGKLICRSAEPMMI